MFSAPGSAALEPTTAFRRFACAAILLLRGPMKGRCPALARRNALARRAPRRCSGAGAPAGAWWRAGHRAPAGRWLVGARVREPPAAPGGAPRARVRARVRQDYRGACIVSFAFLFFKMNAPKTQFRRFSQIGAFCALLRVACRDTGHKCRYARCHYSPGHI